MTKILIDVRSEEEYEAGHRDGAVNVPMDRIMTGDLGVIGGAAKDTAIECYCASGARSAMVKNILEKHGYPNVSNLGGME